MSIWDQKKDDQMDKNNKYEAYFAAASVLTNHCPHLGAKFLNQAVPLILSNRFIIHKNMKKNLNILKNIRKFEKILVISDLNIGDAVNLQASILALRQYFPESQIDYVVNPVARNLIEGNTAISRVYSFFSGQAIPTDEDYRTLANLIEAEDYDVIFNFCPLFDDGIFSTKAERVIHYSLLASRLIKNEKSNGTINQIGYQVFSFIDMLLSQFSQPIKKHEYRGVQVTLASNVINEARAFLLENGLLEKPIQVFYNPDTSSKFTRVPLLLQIKLLDNLLGLPAVKSVLLGAGQKISDIERVILASLPAWKKQKITVIPKTVPIDVYAALIDFADIFITGDTGPLHIAASRKASKSANYTFRNETSVISIFGATPSKIYGYDSSKEGYFPANQNAPSRTFVAESPCRNITCINKMAKTCKEVRCFDSLDIYEINGMVNSILKKHRPMKISVRENKKFLYNNLVKETR